MDTQKICQHCGKPLNEKAVHGLCPECLLKAGIGSEAGSRSGAGRYKGFIPPEPAELAAHFPHLEILEPLGSGGMGAVYKARQKGLNRFVALKVMPPDSGGPAFAERFTREAQALARLNHPGIVSVHEFGQAGGYCFFVMEFVDGANLRQLLRAHRLSPREAMSIVPQICEALQYAHDQGIVHRDIKPENVLVDKSGRVKIADFGLAKLLGREPDGEPLTRAVDVMGTPQYMAPEQLEKPLEVDHRADIYSLGVVFYEMLTGELPLGRFAAPSRKVEVDVRLDEIVLRALEKEPGLRYQQARVFKTEVETISGDPRGARLSPPAAAQSGNRATPDSNVMTARLALGLLLLSLLGTPVLLALTRREDEVLIFGGIALLLALAFGIASWRERLGRLVAIIILCLVGGSVLLITLVVIPLNLGRKRDAEAIRRQDILLQKETLRGTILEPLPADPAVVPIPDASAPTLARVPSPEPLAVPILPGQPSGAQLSEPPVIESSVLLPVYSEPGPLPSSLDSSETPADDTNPIPVAEYYAGGDTNKLYFLIGNLSQRGAVKAARPLLLVLPGGDGGRDFNPFVKRIWRHALSEDYLVAELVAPKWDERQFNRLVWPTEKVRYPAMKFSTEEFVRAVIADVDKRNTVDPSRIFTLSWSSGGPAAYAISMDPKSRVTGSFIAMSVFKPEQLPDRTNASGHCYYLLHSPADFIPIAMAQRARVMLTEGGAMVNLQTYEGGHGWHGNVFGMIRTGITWLENHTAQAKMASRAIPTRFLRTNVQPQSAPPEELAEDLKARFSAALAIQSFSERDVAMAAVARSAARAGEMRQTQTALSHITGFSTRDDAALNAARELLKIGRRSDAIEIARSITSFSVRDAALRELAQ